jgi:hypothetical protein
MTGEFKVTIKIVREHFATITVRARDQAAADKAALARYWHVASTTGLDCAGLGLPPPWDEGEPRDFDPEIDTTFRCVDCGKDTMGGEYYSVTEEVWAASGLAPHGGMLCLADLERRIGRWLTLDDFEDCPFGVSEDWERHVAARLNDVPTSEPAQLDLLDGINHDKPVLSPSAN